ncbi:hypothetical protein F2Q70_00045568 [Brassica cretica]|uniref:Uncharacterized protein n=1 Tax=Brassica cretica TaxID=69181 RepID=A0A8S9KGP8_BRACR|nr:hypothetical protein F2Q70_00045568 [Brassica cretica]
MSLREVAPGSFLRERPGCVAPKTTLPGHLLASDLREVAPKRRWRVSSWRRSGRSLPCIARPMITLITSFELQMHPNVSKNSMWYSNT